MKFPDLQLPTNRKFGLFLCFVFLSIATYFLYLNSFIIAFCLIFIGLIIFLIAILKARLLFPLNLIWMRFGYLLGLLISPLVMATIYFGLITPYSIFIRIKGRDELKLRLKKNRSKWRLRIINNEKTDFKKQF